MPDIVASHLKTPEVNVYYTVRGSGPMLLILQGGAGNADGSEALANELARDFTVVTYDRRGLSRSTPILAERYEIATHADDAARLIDALSGGPAFAFGSRLGALIGVELVARHPGVVRLLVAHEPGLYALLEGAGRDEALRGHREALETFQREGVPAAMKLMFARSGTAINDREAEIPAPSLSAADPKAMEQHFANLRHFLKCDVPAVTRYQPDVAAVAAARSKIIPAVGSASSPSALPYRCTVALAGVLHRTPVEFPGGHTAYMLRPKAVAQRIGEIIRQEGIELSEGAPDPFRVRIVNEGERKMVHETIQGTFRQTNLTNESAEYLAKREELRLAEIELVRQRERVAEVRRHLPPGPAVEDYKFIEGPVDLDSGDTPTRTVRLSELFSAAERPLVIYHLIYGKRQTKPCPMCTAWIDGINGVAHHIAQRVDFAIVAAADPASLRKHARARGWSRLRLLSAGDSMFKYDFGSEDREGNQDSTISVFTQESDGAVHHFYTAHPWMSPEIKERGIDLMSPIWHILDLTPQGRGDWYTKLEYPMRSHA